MNHTRNVDAVAMPVAAASEPTNQKQIDVLVNKVDLIRHDGNEALRALPSDAPLFAVTDVVAALGHLRQAAVLFDKANDVLEADAKQVTR